VARVGFLHPRVKIFPESWVVLPLGRPAVVSSLGADPCVRCEFSTAASAIGHDVRLWLFTRPAENAKGLVQKAPGRISRPGAHSGGRGPIRFHGAVER